LVWIGQRRKIKSERAIAKKNEQIRSAEFKELMTDLELKALRAQMNPHFVFNSMNSINRMILENRNEEASRNLTKFSKLIRMILEHSERERITVPEEMNLIKSYVELEEVRLKGQIDLRFEVDPSLDLEVTEIPSMLLQPVVENAIWHGIAPTTGNSGRIDINLELENDMIICSITDDGIGFESANQTNSHKSMATSIIKDRLTSLSDGQSDSFELINRSSIEEGVCGTVARMKFPI